MSEYLRFAPEVLKRLGEELNPNPEQGILELVRNSYDADAGRCTVKLSRVAKKGGVLTIIDNGTGMTKKQLEEAWLVLGRSPKNAHGRTEKFDRLAVGSKGLGRLAALRLGAKAELRTRPASAKGIEFVLTFDWERFAKAKTVDEVALDIKRQRTKKQPGTTIVVKELKRRFTKTEVTRIARALLLLASPFDAPGSFRPRLDAPEFKSLEKLVRGGYWNQAAYEVHAGLDEDGRAWAEMIDHERGGRSVEASHKEIRREKGKPPYSAPEGEFELSVFRLSGDVGTRSRTSGISLTAMREWLRIVGGVHLYHRGLRVYPYGDPGSDWLDMNLRRAASPEERPSTNNSIGRVTVLDEDAVLQQKTDRTGFIETMEFEDLRTFAQDVLDWAASTRLKEAELRRKVDAAKARDTLETAQVRLHEEISIAPRETRVRLAKAERDVRRATSRRVETLSRDLELYRSLATIGTTTAVMAHEAFNPPNSIIRLAKSVRRRAKKLLGDDYGKIEEPVDLIESNARRMATLVTLPRRLLDSGKRSRGNQSLNEVVEETLAVLSPLIEDHQVRVESEYSQEEPTYVGTIASMESVVANLVINAVSALDSRSKGERLIRVQTNVDEDSILLDVADNGPGIRNIDLDEIWLPGRSTTNRGVGLGLTIVRDIVADLDGNAAVESKGDLGGAQFVIQIPSAGR